MIPAAGDVVILRGLLVHAANSSREKYPPRVAIVVRVAGDVVIVRLRIGGLNRRPRQRWCRMSRRCVIANVARLATPREVVLGMAVDPLPAAVAA